MLHKQHNSVITLAILLALVGVSKPAKAFLIAQSDSIPTTFTVPEQLPENTKVQIAASNSTASINQSLKESFTKQYPQAEINIETQDSNAALKSLSEGKADLVAIGRSLTAAEKNQGFVTVPVSWEKIAFILSKDSPYEGNLTISQVAQIFRGEITDWSELGGSPGQIQVVDLPDTNDTRQAFPGYPVFQTADFITGSNSLKLEQDSTDQMIGKLEKNSIGYAVANDVINRDDVKIVTIHQTQPDDPRYPFSQPFNLVYQKAPTEAAQAFLGFATTDAGQQIIANRVGSLSTTAAAAIANSNVDNKFTGETSDVAPKPQADNDVDGEDDAAIADADTEGSGEPNPDVEGSGELNPDVEGSGELNPDVEGSGELNPDVEGSGELNPDVEDSGELNPDVEDSGELNSENNLAADNVVQADATSNSEANSISNNNDAGSQDVAATASKGKWRWLLLLLLPLGALALYLFGRGQKSDQEPAVSNISNPNAPQGETNLLFNPNTDNSSSGGSNIASDLDSVAANAIGTTSKLGGAAIATGGAAVASGAAAAANLADDTEEDIDLNLEQFVLDEESNNINLDTETNTDLDLLDTDDLVFEIPSNPVNEFTDQETQLQTTDQPTKLQTDTVDDVDNDNFGLLDNLSPAEDPTIAESAAIAGDTAAPVSSFFSNQDTEQTTELQQDEPELSAEETSSNDLADNLVPEPETTPVDFDTINQLALDEMELDQETSNDLSSLEMDLSDAQDSMTQSASVGFFSNQDTEQTTELQQDEPELSAEETSSNDLADNLVPEPETTPVDFDTINQLGSDEMELDQETSNDLSSLEMDLSDAQDSMTQSASVGFFSNQDTEQTTELQQDEPELSAEETSSNDLADNLVPEPETTPVDFDTTNQLALDEMELDQETSNDLSSLEMDLSDAQDSMTQSASVGFFSNQDTEQTTELQQDEPELSAEETSSNDLADNLVPEPETTPVDFDTINQLGSDEMELDQETSNDLSSLEMDLSDAQDSMTQSASVGFFSNQDTEQTTELQQDEPELSAEETSSNDLADNLVPEPETTPVDFDTTNQLALDEMELDQETSNDLSSLEMDLSDAQDSMTQSASVGFFSNQDTEQTTELQQDEPELSAEETSSNDLADNLVPEPETTPVDFDTTNQLALDEMELDQETSNDLSSLEMDLSDAQDSMTQSASVGFFSNQDTEQTTELQQDEPELSAEETSSDVSEQPTRLQITDVDIVDPSSGDTTAEVNEFIEGNSDTNTHNDDLSNLGELLVEETSSNDLADDLVAEPETTPVNLDNNLDQITFDDEAQSFNASLDEISFDDEDNQEDNNLDQITFDDEAQSFNASLDEISFDDEDNQEDNNLDQISFDDEAQSFNASLDEISFDDEDNQEDNNLDQITFNDEAQSFNASLDEISFDDEDNQEDNNLDQITFNDEAQSFNASLDEISFDDEDNQENTNLDQISFNDEAQSFNASLDEISFDDEDNQEDNNLDQITFNDEAQSFNASLDEIGFDDEDNQEDNNLDQITFNDEAQSFNASLDDISFDDEDNQEDNNLDQITFNDEAQSFNASLDDISFDDEDNQEDNNLDQISFDDNGSNLIDELISDIGTVSNNQEITLDDLGFDESHERSTADLLSNDTTQITDLSDDKSNDINDMSNISEWLDSLETPSDKNSDNISEWLDKLSTSDNNLEPEDQNNERVMESKDEAEDISFQFLEDLLERDSDTNQDNK